MRNQLKRWQLLASWEKRLLLRFVLWLPMVRLGLKLTGFKRLQSFAMTEIPPMKAPRLPPGLKPAEYARRCAELVAIAARRGLYQVNCLPQALVLSRVLRGQALNAQLRIGVKPGVQPFKAHAWVELDKQRLGQTDDDYIPFSGLGFPDDLGQL